MEQQYDWMQAYQEYLKRLDLSQGSIEAYLSDVRSFAAWYQEVYGNALDPGFSSVDVQSFRDFQLDVEQVAPATWNRRLSALRSLAEWGVKQGYLSYDPTFDIDLVETQQLAPKWMELADMNRFLSEVEREVHACAREGTPIRNRQALRNQAMIYMMVMAGLRVGEVVSLRRDQVVIQERSGWVGIRRGKGDKFRRVPLNKKLRAVLLRYERAHVEEYLVPGEAPVLCLYSKWYFAGQNGEPLTTRTVQRAVEGLAYYAELMDVTPHVLRHTFARRLVERGVRLEVVAELLGHSRLETTRRYVLPGEADLQEAVEKL